LSVDVTLTGRLNPSDENLSWGPTTFHVEKDGTLNLSDGSLDTGGLYEDSARFSGLKISNNGANAI
jgi:hypothetical protein